MGTFNRVKLSKSIHLPDFPEATDISDIVWQSKDMETIANMDDYRVTFEGRIERKVIHKTQMTEQEKKETAKNYGFLSWEELKEFHEELKDEEEGLFHKSPSGKRLPFRLSDKKELGVEWVDQSYHGSFTIKKSTKNIDGIDRNTHLRYELRFTDGYLVDSIKLR